jgi:hypothetical protein
MATVAPATLADVPALADIFFSGFNDDFFQPIFPQTPEVRAYIEEGYSSWIVGKEGRQKALVYVVKDNTGRFEANARGRARLVHNTVC